MTPDEIQALRKKHQPYKTVRDYEWCDAGCNEPYPCDVIKVLDAFDELKWELELALNDLREVESRLEVKSCHGGQTGKFCSECGEKL